MQKQFITLIAVILLAYSVFAAPNPETMDPLILKQTVISEIRELIQKDSTVPLTKLKPALSFLDQSVQSKYWFNPKLVKDRQALALEKQAIETVFSSNFILLNKKKTLMQIKLETIFYKIVLAEEKLARNQIQQAIQAKTLLPVNSIQEVQVRTLIQQAQTKLDLGVQLKSNSNTWAQAMNAFLQSWEQSNFAISLINFNTPPKIQITNVQTLTNNSWFNVTARVTDGLPYALTGTTTVNTYSSNAQFSSTPITLTASLTARVLLWPGMNTIRVSAKNNQNKTGHTDFNVFLDNTRPDFNIVILTENPTIQDSNVWFKVTANEKIKLAVAGKWIAFDSNEITGSTPLRVGRNYLDFHAIDLVGNREFKEIILLMDEDSLPTRYEQTVLRTDPLNADSDSNLTQANEANNGILDDLEDFDLDALNNYQEYLSNTNPFQIDSDNDGLMDGFEVNQLNTNPLQVTPNNTDSDQDGLTDLQEQLNYTNPLNPDTDGDSLTDGNEINLNTNPLLKDSDQDGLDDDSEIRLNTNPIQTDTDQDTTNDGQEYFTQTVIDENLNVSVTLNAQGDAEKELTITKVEDVNNLTERFAGIGDVYSFEYDKNFTTATITLPVDENQAQHSNALRMVYYDENTNTFQLVTNSEYNSINQTITADVNHFSTYSVLDLYSADSKIPFWLTDWQPHSRLATSGTTIRVHANVRNASQGSASNVQVKFYAETSDSMRLQGSQTISNISAGETKEVTLDFIVFSGITKITVAADEPPIIAELDETNNVGHFSDVTKYLDSDSDGLSDHEEVHGMRVAFPETFVTSNPYNPDSDGDGLSDGQEMGQVINDAENLDLFRQTIAVNRLIPWSNTNISGLNENSYDGKHYQYFSNPSARDSDGDGLDDPTEMRTGSNPRAMDGPHAIMEFLTGFGLGEYAMDNDSTSAHSNPPFLGGYLISGFVLWGDLRGAANSAQHLDGLNFTLNLIALYPALDIEATGVRLTHFTTKYTNTLLDNIKITAKLNASSAEKIRLLDKTILAGAGIPTKASDLVRAGATEEDVLVVAAKASNLPNTLAVTKVANRNIVAWLENSQLAHILEQHFDQLRSTFGWTESQIKEKIVETLKYPNLVEYGVNQRGQKEYQYIRRYIDLNDRPREFKVIISDELNREGYIVTAFHS